MRAFRRSRTTSATAAISLLALGAAAAGGCGGENDFEGGQPGAAEVIAAVTYSGHDYVFYQSSGFTWQQARQICLSNDTHLVSITSVGENSFVTGQIAQHGGGTWWIGYTDQVAENTWKWDGGAPSGYTNWNAGEPNNYGGNENCATTNSATGKWNDLNCNSALQYVCERDGAAAGATYILNYSKTDTNSAQRNYAEFSIFLNGWQGITFGTCGVPSGTLTTGDSYLRFFGPGNVQLAVNDDACVSLASNLSYTPSMYGTYSLHAGCYDDTACSGTVAIRVDPSMPPPAPHP